MVGREELLGPNHKDTLLTKGNYAFNLIGLDRHPEREKLFIETIASQEKVLGPNYRDTLLSKSSYSNVLWEKELHKQTERLLLPVIKV